MKLLSNEELDKYVNVDEVSLKEIRNQAKSANTQSELLSRAEPLIIALIEAYDNNSLALTGKEVLDSKSLLNDIRLLNGKETNGKFKV